MKSSHARSKNTKNLESKNTEESSLPVVTGAKEIDKTVVSFCPEISKMSTDGKEFVCYLISVLIFKKRDFKSILIAKTNKSTVDFLDGIKNIVEEQDLKDFNELENYLIQQKQKLFKFTELIEEDDTDLPEIEEEILNFNAIPQQTII